MNLPTYIFEFIVRVSHTHKCLSISFSACWPEVFTAICWKFWCTVWEPNSSSPVQHHNSFKKRNEYKGNKLCYSLMFFPLSAIKAKHCSTHLYCGQMMQEQHMDQEVDHYRACIQSLQSTTKQWSCGLVCVLNYATEDWSTSFNMSPFSCRSQEEVSGCSPECQICYWLSLCWVAIHWCFHPCTDTINRHHSHWATCTEYT